MDREDEPIIQRSGKIPLNAMEVRVLQHVFQDFRRVAVEAEYGAGYSGCHVLRVRPIEASGVAHRPELVKIGPTGVIAEEWRAYDTLVRTTLPRIAWVTSPPMLDPATGWGAMRYELVGAGIFEVQSLSQYYRHASTEDLVWVLQKRLFRVLSRSWWLANRADSAFQFCSDYDHLLPVNLLLSATEPAPATSVPVITPHEHAAADLRLGSRVCLQAFAVVEVEAERNGLTLNHPEALAGRPFDAYRVRVEGLAESNHFEVGEIIGPLYGVVTATRHSLLTEHVTRTVGSDVNLGAARFSLRDGMAVANPLLAYQDLLTTFHEVNLSTIHGDLNLENVLVDPETRDVKLIDFASVRNGHNLHDLLRLETGVVTTLLSQTLAEAALPARTIVPLYHQLDRAVFRPRPGSTARMLPDALEKPYAMLLAIRQEAHKCLFNPEDPSEYYAGLALYLLGALKFKNLDEIPDAKPMAFLGAGTAIDLLAAPTAERPYQVAIEDKAPPTSKAAGRSRQPAQGIPWRWITYFVLALAVIGAVAFLLSGGRQRPIAIDTLCEVEDAYVVDIVDSPARGANLLDYFEIGSPELFEHIDNIEQIYRDGQPHRGLSYVWGPPAVGKSLITRDLLGSFSGSGCLVKISDLFGPDADKLSFDVATMPDTTTLDGSIAFDAMPGIVRTNEFDLNSMMDAAGCRQNGDLLPLIIFDDLDEVTKETSEVILRAIDRFMLEAQNSPEIFVHLFVFGRPEGFAPWFQNSRRNDAVAPLLQTYFLGGLYIETTGDLAVLADEEFSFIYGEDTWAAMKQDGTAAEIAADYIRYIERHPILTYSVRSLGMATMFMERASANPDDSEAELKAFLFDELLKRANNTHGRPLSSDDQYLRILEEVAVRYSSVAPLDEDGYFSVGANATVPVTDEKGNAVGEVLVRDVLDHSGIAYLEPASFSTPRYRFYPIWVHSHLVELYNQRTVPQHNYRSCHP